MKKIISIYYLLFSTVLLAQDLPEVFKGIKQAVEQHKIFKVDLEYSYYDSETSQKPVETMSGFYVAENTKQYLKINELEQIVTPDFFLKINHKEKMVLLSDGMSGQTMLYVFNLDEIKKQVNIQLLSNPKYWHIVLTPKPVTQFPFSKVDIYYDKKTYLLRSTVIYFLNYFDNIKDIKQLKNVKLVINFRHYVTGDKALKFLPPGAFNIERYLIRQNGSYTGKALLNKYQIINVKSNSSSKK